MTKYFCIILVALFSLVTSNIAFADHPDQSQWKCDGNYGFWANKYRKDPASLTAHRDWVRAKCTNQPAAPAPVVAKAPPASPVAPPVVAKAPPAPTKMPTPPVVAKAPPTPPVVAKAPPAPPVAPPVVAPPAAPSTQPAASTLTKEDVKAVVIATVDPSCIKNAPPSTTSPMGVVIIVLVIIIPLWALSRAAPYLIRRLTGRQVFLTERMDDVEARMDEVEEATTVLKPLVDQQRPPPDQQPPPAT